MEDNLKKRIGDAFNRAEQLAKDVPGYKGYKEKEVRREADKLMRMQVAQGLEEQRRRLSGIQVQLVSAGRLGVLVILDRSLMRLQLLIDRLKTASYGYSGVFSALKVREVELDALYDHDAALLGTVDKVKELLGGVAAAGTDEEVQAAANALLVALDEANDAFSRRQDVVLRNPAV